jgi:hypothetical protein
MEDTQEARRPLGPLTPRQEELIRFLQGLSPERRYTLTILCRGTEPWEIETAVERRKLGDLRPR